MNKLAYIAVLLVFLPIIHATYGNGTIYSLGSATTSIQGDEGNGTTYSLGQRLDFRPVALGTGAYFEEVHAGFWTIGQVIPITSCNNVYELNQPQKTTSDAAAYLVAIFAVLGVAAIGYNQYKRGDENGENGQVAVYGGS